MAKKESKKPFAVRGNYKVPFALVLYGVSLLLIYRGRLLDFGREGDFTAHYFCLQRFPTLSELQVGFLVVRG